MNMMEKMTDRARKAMALARKEAEVLGHNYLGTEHLLIGCLRAGGVAATAMKNVGVDLDKAIVEIKNLVGAHDQHAPDAPSIEQRLEDLVERAYREHPLVTPGMFEDLCGIIAEVAAKRSE